jgi:hypothetical protein
VAIGQYAGNEIQGVSAVAIGNSAGYTGQSTGAVAIGSESGLNSQGADAVAIGRSAGKTSQGIETLAIGVLAGFSEQGQGAVAVGFGAGYNLQGVNSVAIGKQAAIGDQGANAIAIGYRAGYTSQAANSIILNATGAALDQTTANTFTVAPVRNDVANTAQVMFYNTTSKEITYGNTISVAGNITAANLSGNIITNRISSDDSTILTILDGLNVDGDIEVVGNVLTGGTVSATGNISAGNLISPSAEIDYFAVGVSIFNKSDTAADGVVITTTGGAKNTIELIPNGGNSTIKLTAEVITATGNITAGNISTGSRVVTTPVAFSTLTAVTGARAFVNDGNLVAASNFGAQVSGSGSNTVPVWSDGTNWYIG